MNPRHPSLFQLEYLYSGDFDRFEKSLWLGAGPAWDTAVHFHRGHLALVRGDRPGALDHFRQASRQDAGSSPVLTLSKAYLLILEGSPESARPLLEDLDHDSAMTRIPDGEITLLIAEAYACSGEPGRATDLALRAFSQGFGCTAWYERSPLLETVRRSPRWSALHQHLREREAAMGRALR